jgi:hypothetical protein
MGDIRTFDWRKEEGTTISISEELANLILSVGHAVLLDYPEDKDRESFKMSILHYIPKD